MIGLCATVGMRLSKNQNSSMKYFLSDRNLQTLPLALSLLATQVGGGAIVGTADTTFHDGLLAALTYPLGISTGLLILSLGLGGRLRSLQVNTIPELFKVKYQSQFLHRASAGVSLITLFLILVATAIALRSFCGFLSIENPVVIGIIWMSFVIYTSLGGLQAVVATDRLQISFILVLFLAVLLTFLYDHERILTLGRFSFDGDSFFRGEFSWRSYLYAMCFTVIGQDMGQRCLAASDERKVTLSTRIAALLMLIMAIIPTGLSLLLRSSGTHLSDGDCLILRAVSVFLGKEFASLFAVAVIVAIISTADSLICSMSSHIQFDLGLWPHAEDKQRLRRSKLLTASLGVLAFVMSFGQQSIISLMVTAYEIFVGLFFIPIVMTLLAEKPSQRSAMITVGAGLFTMIAVRLYPMPFDTTFLNLLLLTAVYWGTDRLEAFGVKD